MITCILMDSIIELPCKRQKCSEHFMVFYDIVMSLRPLYGILAELIGFLGVPLHKESRGAGADKDTRWDRLVVGFVRLPFSCVSGLSSLSAHATTPPCSPTTIVPLCSANNAAVRAHDGLHNVCRQISAGRGDSQRGMWSATFAYTLPLRDLMYIPYLQALCFWVCIPSRGRKSPSSSSLLSRSTVR
jgi:hypothetical protein